MRLKIKIVAIKNSMWVSLKYLKISSNNIGLYGIMGLFLLSVFSIIDSIEPINIRFWLDIKL